MLAVPLPDVSGLNVCRQLRSSGHGAVPALFLAALGGEDDLLCGLDSSADDYLDKSYNYSPRELSARVRSLLRRAALSEKPAPKFKILRVGGLAVPR